MVTCTFVSFPRSASSKPAPPCIGPPNRGSERGSAGLNRTSPRCPPAGAAAYTSCCPHPVALKCQQNPETFLVDAGVSGQTVLYLCTRCNVTSTHIVRQVALLGTRCSLLLAHCLALSWPIVNHSIANYHQWMYPCPQHPCPHSMSCSSALAWRCSSAS